MNDVQSCFHKCKKYNNKQILSTSHNYVYCSPFKYCISIPLSQQPGTRVTNLILPLTNLHTQEFLHHSSASPPCKIRLCERPINLPSFDKPVECQMIQLGEVN